MPDDLSTDGADPPDGLTLEEMTAESGVPERTVRFYRQIGLIAAPERIGRRAYYTPDQLPRLRLIADLRERGLGLDAIAKVLENPVAESRALSSLLQVGDELRVPWTEDESARMTEAQVVRSMGLTSADVLPDLERFGILVRVPRSDPPSFDVPSVLVLDLASRLVTAGVEPDLASEAWALMTLRLEELSRELVTLFTDRVGLGFSEDATPEQIMTAFRGIRPIALDAIQLAFAHEIERALVEFVDHGGVFDVTKRAWRPRPELGSVTGDQPDAP